MSHRKKLVLWPGLGSLLTWFFGPDVSTGLAMILLVVLTAYIPAALARQPNLNPKLIALGAFLIWLAVFWLTMLATIPFRSGLADWVSARLALGRGVAVFFLMLGLFALAGFAAGVVQLQVLRRKTVQVSTRYSLIGLTAGFTILGCGFIWYQTTGHHMTIMLSCFLCGVPSLALLEAGRTGPPSRFPVRAVLMGETLVTRGLAIASALIATGIAALVVVQSGLSFADFNPMGRHGTALLSLAFLWCLMFIIGMGYPLLVQVARISKAQISAAGEPPDENSTLDTDGWSIVAIMLATGLVGLYVLLLGLSAIEALGFRITDAIPKNVLIAMIVALFLVARGTFGVLLDFLFLGAVVWALYGLYVILTLDPVNYWISDTVEWLVPG